MSHYLVTHGHRQNGPDPGHNQDGFKQLNNLVLPNNITRVVVGTGRRFEEMLLHFYQSNQLSTELPRYFSPFCGGAEGFDVPDEITLVTGTCISLKAEYIGMNNKWGFNPHGFIRSQPERTLFLTGDELMMALGVTQPTRGALYHLSRNNKVQLLRQG